MARNRKGKTVTGSFSEKDMDEAVSCAGWVECQTGSTGEGTVIPKSSKVR
jgi:hypothetical protein